MNAKETLLAFEEREMPEKRGEAPHAGGVWEDASLEREKRGEASAQKRGEASPWPELPEERPPCFPAELLPESCAALVKAVAANIPVPVDYPACALLGTASAALVGRVDVQPRPGHQEPVQLYQCMGGKSGTNKSAVLSMFIKPLRDWLNEQNNAVCQRNRERARKRAALEGRLKGSRLKDAERLELERELEAITDEVEFELIQEDTTPEGLARRMHRQGGKGIIFTDEGNFINVLAGTTYGKQGGQANLDTVLKGWSGGAVTVDRATGDCYTLRRADLSVTVGMQPGLVARMCGHEELADRGFPQRLLYYLPEPLLGKNLKDLPDIPAGLLSKWRETLLILAQVHRDEHSLLTFTKGARELYIDHRQDMEDRQLSDLGGNEALGGWARKAHGQTARLAGLLALLEDPGATMVEESHVRAAVALMNGYYIPHAKQAFGGGNVLSAPAQALRDMMRIMPEFKATELYRRLAGQKQYKGTAGRERFASVLEELRSLGYIRLKDQPTQASRGRPPCPVWEVHPAVWQTPDTPRPTQEGTQA